MRHRIGRSLAATAVLAALSGVALLVPAIRSVAQELAEPAANRPVATPPFVGGERLRYALAWLSVGGGEMSIETTGPAPYRNRNAYTIKLQAASNAFFSKFYVVDDTILSIVDAERFESMKFEKHTKEGRHQKDQVAIFDLDKRETFWKGEKVKLPPHVVDTLSAVWYLRLLPLEVGKTIYLDAINNGKLYKLRVDVVAAETIKVPAGTFKTLRLEPKMEGGFLKAKDGKLQIWVTDDASRTPVQIRTYLPLGHITAALLRPDQKAPSGQNAFPAEKGVPTAPPGAGSLDASSAAPGAAASAAK